MSSAERRNGEPRIKATPCERDGHRFPSKLERKLYDQLVLERDHGDVAYFLRQVPIHLPGGGMLRVDFEVHYKDGRKRYIDAKGYEKPEWRATVRIVEALYPIKIETWPQR